MPVGAGAGRGRPHRHRHRHRHRPPLRPSPAAVDERRVIIYRAQHHRCPFLRPHRAPPRPGTGTTPPLLPLSSPRAPSPPRPPRRRSLLT
ncbi:hypothetical protein GQ55_2G395300 [Panicum hallii var. hallii]|uniref:Uncharacterized protein n=1 Tax=Panicum hallii var. hallii TaxID=1504633 RepID=A0A2T7EXB0_9POAL|nr:hypothetical protein GQ55_2G395300 [Panicum hallii var. hallii]